jgi:D-psicose/D-tagatose/L-ribulose 3-epimerase
MTKNPVGVHALVWTGGWTPADAELAISSSKQAGFDLIEIPALDPATVDVVDTKARLAAHGMKSSFTLGLAVDSDINSEDLAMVDRGRKTLMDALEVARGTGATYLGGVIFGAITKYPAPTTEKARRNSAMVIKELAQEAAKDNISIGLEFVNRYESNLLNTVSQTLDYMDIVDEPNVVVHADVYHMNIEENGFRNPLLLCGDRLGYVHIGESHRGYLGTGTINFDEVFGALVDMNYQGPITFESFSSAVVDRHLSTALAVWRNLWSDGMDLAVSARGFIEAGLSQAEATRGSR